MEKVAVAICNLEMDLEKLQKNDAFITIYLNATLAAVKTHQQEKIQYLLNAVLNSAQGGSIKDDFKNIFIRYVDEMTAAHIIVLQVLYDDREVVKNISSYNDLYAHFLKITKEPYPEKFEFKALCSDLIARSLLQVSSSVEDFSGMNRHSFLLIEEDEEENMIRITELGVDFLIYISCKGKK